MAEANMNTLIRYVLTVTAAALIAAGDPRTGFAQDGAEVKIQTVAVRDGLHMVVAEGAGNLGVLSGSDGIIVIDSQYQDRSEKLLAAIRAISDRPLRFVINTHWHQDHAGGNAGFAGAGGVLVAQDNARVRLAKGQFMSIMQRMVEPAEPAALNTITFSESMHFFLNGQDIHVLHVPNAHTDGDAIIHFPGLNALHTGDTYISRMYPFIDAESGGSLAGLIAAIERVLPLLDDKTVIIPGHGGLSNKAEYAAYRDMLKGVAANVQREIDKGATREQALAAKPTQAFDAIYGAGFFKADMFAGTVFDQLSAR
jgi:cyclase